MESKSTFGQADDNRVRILDTTKILEVKCSDISGSEFTQFCMNNSLITDVSATNVKISDANLSDLEIEGAQLGGAFIHNIGMPPVGHPMYNPEARQRPLKFENCDLNGSTITNCDLSNVQITDCNLNGFMIEGIAVEDLLKAYKAR
ncbi:MAG TPA: pentapeptide repeat-containing protein [Mucilaginibacter sp.]|nr:pentapeptide repeat-containing protein [Mucilaginibacter sp.]